MEFRHIYMQLRQADLTGMTTKLGHTCLYCWFSSLSPYSTTCPPYLYPCTPYPEGNQLPLKVSPRYFWESPKGSVSCGHSTSPALSSSSPPPPDTSQRSLTTGPPDSVSGENTKVRVWCGLHWSSRHWGVLISIRKFQPNSLVSISLSGLLSNFMLHCHQEWKQFLLGQSLRVSRSSSFTSSRPSDLAHNLSEYQGITFISFWFSFLSTQRLKHKQGQLLCHLFSLSSWSLS